MRKRNVSTVRPSEIDTGMPVSIRPNSRQKMIHGVGIAVPATCSPSGTITSSAGRNIANLSHGLIGADAMQRRPASFMAGPLP